MHSVVPMRIAKISHVVLSLLLFAIGIVLVVKPTLSVTFLEKILRRVSDPVRRVENCRLSF